MVSVTANYGWTKPDPGASDDVWGGQWNGNLDGIDAKVHDIEVRGMTPGPPGATGPAGPTAVSTDAGNSARLGGDSLIYVPPASGMGDNRIINGDMRIDQRNNGAGGTASGYTCDRWQYYGAQASKGTWQRVALGAGGLAVGLGYALQFTSSSAYTPLAADTFIFAHFIEADAISDFAWGTAQAQPVTLSFWAYASPPLTGTFSGVLQNYAGTRSYPFTFSLPASNTWTKFVITIPGDTAGTWVLQGNAGALGVIFDLGGGSSKRGPANAWAGATYNGATGAANVVATSGAQLLLTGVKLEIGNVATPYNRQSLAKSMADCQRYYQVGQVIYSTYGTAGQMVYGGFNLPVTMRASPTMAVTNTASVNTGVIAAGNYNPTSMYVNANVVAVGSATLAGNYTASAEL